MCFILFVVVWFLWFILQDHKLLRLWHIDALAPTGAGTNWNIKNTHRQKEDSPGTTETGGTMGTGGKPGTKLV